MEEILDINYQKHKLDNGLEVILYKDNSLPIVTVNLWYKVGSANESPNKTGFAHLFEHMMFQGSENVPKELHFKYIQEAGGTLNGSTSLDRTNYYETVPSNNLELPLWLESDRMGFFLESLTEEKLENQREVVMNERRQNYDDQPYGLSWEILFSNLFPAAHPYSWPTIGYLDHIKNFQLDEVKEFFKTYYSPSNACLAIGGDLEFEITLEKVKKYFEEIPAGKSIPEIPEQVCLLEENKFITHEDNVQLERIYFAFHSPAIFETGDAEMDVLSDILSGGKNSRLYKKLVFEEQIAQDVSCFQYSGKLNGAFFIVATARPGSSLDEIKKIIFEEIDLLIDQGITEQELTRSKNIITSNFIYSLQNLNSMVNQINAYNFHLNNPNAFQQDLDRYKSLTVDEIRETTKELLKKHFVELRIIPKK